MKHFISLTLLSLFVFTACSKENSGVTPVTTLAPKADKTTEALKKSTYLMSQIGNPKSPTNQNCIKSQYELFQNRNDKKMIEIIDSQEVQTELLKVLGDATIAQKLTKQMKTFYNLKKENDGLSDLYIVCKKNKNIYVLFQPVGMGFIATLWKDQESFEYFSDGAGNIHNFGDGDGPGGVFFLTDSIGENSLVYSFAKDFPSSFYWTIESLDPKTLQVTEIEKCNLNINDKSSLSCDKQYKK